MAVVTSDLTSLLKTIGDALSASQTAFPEDSDSLLGSTDGISLLDVKNDLLLSYLQHLVFLILLRLQNVSNPAPTQKELNKKVISKLIELRAYLDRGCRPLESKLRYQIDKVLRAADDADRNAAQKTQTNGVAKKKKSKKPKATTNYDSDISISGSEVDSNESDAATNDSDEEDLHTAPRLSLLASSTAQKQNSTNAKQSSSTRGGDQVYRPPRITPTSMPTPTSSRPSTEETASTRRRKHALLDEYITEETSNAPTAQPSIGSNNTITQSGRVHTSMSSRDRDAERERTAYEEASFTRLPAASKADKKKDRARRAREGRDMFGGEDWTGLGGLGDRIERSVSGRGGGKGGVLERREKRKRETGDLPRGDGVGIGESFEKRRKVLAGRDRKKGRR